MVVSFFCAIVLLAGLAVMSIPLVSTSLGMEGVLAASVARPAAIALEQSTREGRHQNLKLVHRVEPLYPEEARRLHVEGDVTLEATVNEKGEVADLRVIAGPALLVKAALNAVKQWKYEPPEKAPVRMNVTIKFKLPMTPVGEDRTEAGQAERLTLLSQGHVVIPSDPKCRGDGSDVDVTVTVGRKGEVIDAKAVSGPECLRNDVVRWVRTFRYSPPARPPATTSFSFGITESKTRAPHDLEPDSSKPASQPGDDTAPEHETTVTPPVPVYKPEPPYSDEARKAGLEGTVVLSITVDPQGNVKNIRVVKPLGKGLDQNAVDTVRSWKFKPAAQDGKPVEFSATVEVAFRLYKNKTARSPRH